MNPQQAEPRVGLKIGRITIIKATGKCGGSFLIECECGKRRRVFRSYLVAGAHSTCGHKCPLGSHAETHGQSVTPTGVYETWSSMRERCLNPNHEAYAYYGGRGITICGRWLESFENFYADMGERPEGKSLDRWPNNDGNYEPGNCRWANWEEQNGNKSNTRRVLLNGEAMCMSKAARGLGISAQVLKWRVRAMFAEQYEMREAVEVSSLGFKPHSGRLLKGRGK